MVFETKIQIINEVSAWGKKNGQKIIQAFQHEGDWATWAQVDLALYFTDFQNVSVSRAQEIRNDGTKADLLLEVDGGKNIAIILVCEELPGNANAIGQDDIYKQIENAYDRLKNVSIEDIRPVAMGLVISGIANDNAKYNLQDKSLFDVQTLYTSDTGINVNLFFRWI